MTDGSGTFTTPDRRQHTPLGNPVVVTATISSASYFRESGERNLADVVFDSCTFDNCRVRGGTFTNAEFLNARIWSCGLDQVVLRDCTVDGLRMTLGGDRGGKTMPLILYGVLAHRVTLRGTIGSVIWNGPGSLNHPVSDDDAVRVAKDFYAQVDDFALDIRDAEFTALPSGPSLKWRDNGRRVKACSALRGIYGYACPRRWLSR